VTSTCRYPETELILQEALKEKDLFRALQVAAEGACRLLGLPKVYFARSIGRRLHHLTGFGQEIYLPPLKVNIGHGYYAFLEGSESLAKEKREALVRALQEIVEYFMKGEKRAQ